MPQIALTLENNGSVARDHLASERTFLAYVRTSLTLASMGVALVQLFSISASHADGSAIHGTKSLHKYARPIAALAISLGLSVLAVGTIRYFIIQHKLSKGVFPVARVFMVGLSSGIACLIAVVFAILLSNE